MTREEAIHFAECLKNNWTINFNDMEEFCDMAIEALSKMDSKENYWKGCETCERAMANGECELWGDRMTEECGAWKERREDEQIR